MKKLNLALIFGGRSAEHEVSIVSALQLYPWINKDKYQIYLIYLDSQNQAYLCPFLKGKNYRDFIKNTLKKGKRVEFSRQGIYLSSLLRKKKVLLDVALLVLHGAYGEDGKLQGMLDFLEIPYTGSGVLGSVLGMDKVIMKKIFAELNLPLTAYQWFWQEDFQNNMPDIIGQLEKKLGYPMFVKPASAGSSIGVNRAENRKKLIKAIKSAIQFDNKILVEQEVKGAIDINCSALGGLQPEVSVCEQPLTEKNFLSFEDKYLKGGKTKGMVGLSRIMPAPIPDEKAEEIQKITKKVFRELNCWGIARIDFLYQKKTGKVFVNEINTIPGSLAYYFWKVNGIEPGELIDRLVELALEKMARAKKLNYRFQSPILDQK